MLADKTKLRLDTEYYSAKIEDEEEKQQVYKPLLIAGTFLVLVVLMYGYLTQNSKAIGSLWLEAKTMLFPQERKPFRIREEEVPDTKVISVKPQQIVEVKKVERTVRNVTPKKPQMKQTKMKEPKIKESELKKPEVKQPKVTNENALTDEYIKMVESSMVNY